MHNTSSDVLGRITKMIKYVISGKVSLEIRKSPER